MIHPNAGDKLTVRSVFIIDPKKVRLALSYPVARKDRAEYGCGHEEGRMDLAPVPRYRQSRPGHAAQGSLARSGRGIASMTVNRSGAGAWTLPSGRAWAR